MILTCEWGAKKRHDSIAHHLVDGALITVDGFHHPLENGVQEPTGVLRIKVGDAVGGSFYICKKYRDLLSLTLQGSPG